MRTPKKIIALIPARAGSKRIVAKNIRILGGNPLIAYSIHSALGSKIFDRVIVSTESEQIADLAKNFGAEIPFLRPKEYAEDRSPDIDWLKFTLKNLTNEDPSIEAFALLRPTSPFRAPETIQRAYREFCNLGSGIDSMRAVEKCSQHPGKMWVLEGALMRPFVRGDVNGVPWHSSAYQSLPEVYVQNASLEIGWTDTVLKKGSLAGDEIAPFLTNGLEGFDINTEEDWWLAEKHLSENPNLLPRI